MVTLSGDRLGLICVYKSGRCIEPAFARLAQVCSIQSEGYFLFADHGIQTVAYIAIGHHNHLICIL